MHILTVQELLKAASLPVRCWLRSCLGRQYPQRSLLGFHWADGTGQKWGCWTGSDALLWHPQTCIRDPGAFSSAQMHHTRSQSGSRWRQTATPLQRSHQRNVRKTKENTERFFIHYGGVRKGHARKGHVVLQIHFCFRAAIVLAIIHSHPFVVST